jgi:hypothetical protein
MSYRRAVLVLLHLGLCACGGSGDGGGGGAGPLNLTTFQPASVILGQSTASGGNANNGGGLTPNPVGFRLPTGTVANGNGRLYVVDNNNSRIMGWNSIPTGFGAPADFAIGVPDLTTPGGGTSATLLTAPNSCWVAGNALFVADTFNERVLIYSPVPTGNVAANIALGKPDLLTGGGTAGQSGLGLPTDVCVAANRIVVADWDNNRVMIWNGIPSASGANADLVVGQPDFTTVTPGTSATKMFNPNGVWTDGTRLVVADANNNRVLIWNTFPTVNGQVADLVVGQPDFTTGTGGSTAQKYQLAAAVTSDGFQLFVADLNNNRVLIYSPFPTASNPMPSKVLGQSNFTNTASNDDDQDGAFVPGIPTARTLAGPNGLAVIGNNLVVVEGDNHRVLFFTGS